jgi:Calcineurin-like phosphoesterase
MRGSSRGSGTQRENRKGDRNVTRIIATAAALLAAVAAVTVIATKDGSPRLTPPAYAGEPGTVQGEGPAAGSPSLADTTKPKGYYGFAARSEYPEHAVLVGMARDDVEVRKVRVAVRDQNTSLWLQKDGGWGDDRVARTAEVSSTSKRFATWTWRVDLPPGTYRLDVRVKDAADNVRKVKPRRSFTVSDAAPVRPLLAVAGDISRCTNDNDEATASLLDDLFVDRSGVVGVLGDSAYPNGTTAEFAQCYDPTWGRHRVRTRAAVGNHEYNTSNAKAYWDYFGAKAGRRHDGWYAFDLGSWRIIVINSNCSEIGGCSATSPEGRWLAGELADHPTECAAVMMHHPRFSSGAEHGDDPTMGPLWDQFYAGGVDLVLSGHDHNYERLARLDPDGHVDSEAGIRSLIVGTGGTPLRPTDGPRPHSKSLIDDRYGVLALHLGEHGYDYEFVTTVGGAVADSGHGSCD